MYACKSKLESLHEKLTEVLGPEPAETLMEYLRAYCVMHHPQEDNQS